MRKKNFFLSTTLVTLVSIGGYYSYEVLQQQCNVRSTLFLENIEALSAGEMDASECPGPKQYSIAGVMDVRLSARTHSPDSMDIIDIFEARQCVADGFGDLEGNDGFILDYQYVETKKEKCNGSHNTLPFL